MDLLVEQELLTRAQAGAVGFGELFDAYYDRIYAYAYRRVGIRAVAEDIAACTFEDALRGIQRLRWRGKPVSAWLYRIASRRVADHYRQAKTRVALEDWAQAAAEGAPDETVEEFERDAMVRAGLERLSARDREIIRLVYFDELSAAEIAALEDCTTNSVYVRLHRACKRLGAILEPELGREAVQAG